MTQVFAKSRIATIIRREPTVSSKTLKVMSSDSAAGATEKFSIASGSWSWISSSAYRYLWFSTSTLGLLLIEVGLESSIAGFGVLLSV